MGVGGGLLCALGVMLVLTSFLPPGSSLIQNSRLAPLAVGGVDLASTVLPPGLAKAYQERRDALNWRTNEPASAPAPASKPVTPPKGAPSAPTDAKRKP